MNLTAATGRLEAGFVMRDAAPIVHRLRNYAEVCALLTEIEDLDGFYANAEKLVAEARDLQSKIREIKAFLLAA